MADARQQNLADTYARRVAVQGGPGLRFSCFHLWWLAILGAVGIVVAVILRSFVRDVARVIPAAEVERSERRWLDAIREALPVAREREATPDNHGLAEVRR